MFLLIYCSINDTMFLLIHFPHLKTLQIFPIPEKSCAQALYGGLLKLAAWVHQVHLLCQLLFFAMAPLVESSFSHEIMYCVLLRL